MSLKNTSVRVAPETEEAVIEKAWREHRVRSWQGAVDLALQRFQAPWAKLDHHAMVYGRRLAVAILLGALLLSATLAGLARLPRDSARAWLIAYYVLQVASIEAIAIMGPGYIRPVNTAHAVVVAVLFVAWATGETSARVRQPQ